MRRSSKAIAASAAIVIAILAAIVVLATLQTALTTESTSNALNPPYVQPQPNAQVRLRETATAGNLTFGVQNVINGSDPAAQHVWDTYGTSEYAPLYPISGSKYVIVNATVTTAINGTPFSYSDVILVGNDGRSYYANFPAGVASCNASIKAEQLKPGACGVYIAFSIPNDVTPVKVVYTASKPAIVVNLT